MSTASPFMRESSYMESDAKTNFHDPSTLHDRVLLVEGKKFYIQSGLLSVWSEFFRGLFNSDFKEKNADEIKIEELSADEFETFLRVVYTEYFEVKDVHLESLIYLSFRFLAPKVRTVCKRQIDNDFLSFDLANLLHLSCTYNLYDIEKLVLKFIRNNDVTRWLNSLMKVPFEHNLHHLAMELRDYSQDDIPLAYHEERKDIKMPKPSSDVHMNRLKIQFDNIFDQWNEGLLEMTVKDGLVISYMMSDILTDAIEADRPFSPKILLSEGIELAQICQPRVLCVRKLDADEAVQCWKNMQDDFPTTSENLLDDLKIFVIFDLPCKNDIELIFKQMNWTFDESSEKSIEEYGNEEGETDAVKQIVQGRDNMLKYNKFTAEDTILRSLISS